MRIFICFFVLSAVVCSAPVPSWANKWRSNFNETYSKGSTLGNYSFDFNAEISVNYRVNGELDPVCGSTVKEDTPCADIVYQNYRYLYFPEKNECCMCCTAEDGCSVLKPNWMSDAQFEEEETINGEVIYQYYDTDDFFAGTILYYQTGSGTPYEMYVPRMNDRVMYDMSTYTENFEDITLPNICDPSNECSFPSYCIGFRVGDFLKKKKNK